MKIHRLLYMTWQGIDMRCTLEQIKSIPQSDIFVDVRAVSWSATGIEYCGCIIHEHLPDVIQARISPKDTSLEFRSAIPHRHVDIWKYHKLSMRDEWTGCVLKLIDKIAYSNIQQHKLF
mgnify:FL=1|tara:strand:- start:2392 stop:2748 length:357 start_codon:yes stop_codon:yes gene_type:complete